MPGLNIAKVTPFDSSYLPSTNKNSSNYHNQERFSALTLATTYKLKESIVSSSSYYSKTDSNSRNNINYFKTQPSHIKSAMKSSAGSSYCTRNKENVKFDILNRLRC
jgi:hypothetical protein